MTPLYVLYALGCGLALGQVVGLQPIWWLAWIAPAFLLVLGRRAPPARRRVLLLLASVVATSTLLPALVRSMPTAPAVGAVLLLSLVWVFLTGETCRLHARFGGAAWTVLALPVLGVALDTLMAHFLPDGNWNGYAYTQAEVLPVVQIVSVLGVPGLLFVLLLVPATAFQLLESGAGRPAERLLAVATLGVVAGVLLFGVQRLRGSESAAGEQAAFGIAAIDDPIGLAARVPYVASIRDAYSRQVAALAADGARIVVLPEKIAVASPAAAEQWDAAFAAMARGHGIWLLGSVSVAAAAGTANYAWLYSPDGRRDASDQKHHLAPPERSYLPGSEFVVRAIDGVEYGLGICKDMHFASFGREYGRRGVAAMLVPAWDFGVDAELARRMTLVRGIEGGYTIVRASRDGLLSIDDPYGRPLALARSSPLPGASLTARVRLPRVPPTLYVRIGDAFGWLCVAIGAVLLALGRLRTAKMG